MPLKTKICPKCNATFVPETKNQEYCNECLKITIINERRSNKNKNGH